MTEGGSPQPAGWYHAEGDPPGTQRWWDGEMWQGGPVEPPSQSAQPAPNRNYASWGNRVGATLLDTLIVGVPFMVVYALGFGLGSVNEALGAIVGVLLGLPLLLATVYVLLSLPGKIGTSPGRRIMGYEIVSERDGTYIGGGAFLGRQILGGLIDNFCYINSLWPLWDGKNQTLGDKIVKSVAVQTQKRPVLPIFPDGKPF